MPTGQNRSSLVSSAVMACLRPIPAVPEGRDQLIRQAKIVSGFPDCNIFGLPAAANAAPHCYVRWHTPCVAVGDQSHLDGEEPESYPCTACSRPIARRPVVRVEPSVRFSTVVIAFSAISAIYADAQPPAPTNLHIFKPGSFDGTMVHVSPSDRIRMGHANQSVRTIQRAVTPAQQTRPAETPWCRFLPVSTGKR